MYFICLLNLFNKVMVFIIYHWILSETKNLLILKRCVLVFSYVIHFRARMISTYVCVLSGIGFCLFGTLIHTFSIFLLDFFSGVKTIKQKKKKKLAKLSTRYNEDYNKKVN